MSNQNNMCYLSPFVCYGAGMSGRPDIAASESNLSSSGYSSMASPGPSPSCSSKTLCILEEYDATLSRANVKRRDRRMFHRAILSPSLESSSPPPDSPLENISEVLCAIHRSNMGRIMLPSDSEITDDQMAGSVGPAEHESTADYESHDEGIDVFRIRGKAANCAQTVDQGNLVDPKLLSLVRVHKSTSLDSKLIGQRRNNLKVSVQSRSVTVRWPYHVARAL